MKRKRGNNKGKPKRTPVVTVKEPAQNVISLSTEDNSSGSADIDIDELDSGMKIEAPSPIETDQPEKLASLNSDRLRDKMHGKLVYGRVKVKIKSSKALDSQLTSSDAPTQSDTDKSSQHAGPEKHVVAGEKMEDSANSLPDNTSVSGNPSKKAGSIKIKSAKGFGSSGTNLSTNAALVLSEPLRQKEPGLSRRDARHNEPELNAALEVIKKVMKMDAAEPFNAPVDPVALGIPDYFDVIDAPMDFGTICSNLESGVKYMNSEDVFKDVQYIWENCYKYNNKGDYVVELMKRVKKNFMKYWTTSGLYNEQAPGTSGFESTQSEDVTPTSNAKTQVKSGHLKHKSRKRHGVKKHKDDCLCAICVMMRRRLEREESAQIESQTDSQQEEKPEELSPVPSPYGEDTSSNMENSPGLDADADADADLEEKGEEVKLEDTEQLYSPIQEKQEEKGNEMEIQTKGGGESSGHSQPGERSGEEHSRELPTHIVESGADMQVDAPIEVTLVPHEDGTAAVEQQKAKKVSEKRQKAKMFENFRLSENPMLLKLCGTLFPDNEKSVWSGHHSLVRHQDLDRSTSIHEAIMTLMK